MTPLELGAQARVLELLSSVRETVEEVTLGHVRPEVYRSQLRWAIATLQDALAVVEGRPASPRRGALGAYRSSQHGGQP